MPAIAHPLASGPGWRIDDVVCTAGPHEKPFEEQHESICVAAVTDGMFRYRTTQGTALLAPGAVLLGNDRQCFECGHEHASGDRCISFHFAPTYWELVAAGVPGVRPGGFTAPSLPPLAALAPVVAAAEAARECADRAAFEELTVHLIGAVSAVICGVPAGAERTARPPTQRDERRIAAALRRIESGPDQPLPLGELAREASMSPYHFLRVFKRIIGITPRQFVLRTRMHRAAVQLRRSDGGIAAIAFEAGFGDLSTFNRRFLREMGSTPGVYRAGRGRPVRGWKGAADRRKMA